MTGLPRMSLRKLEGSLPSPCEGVPFSWVDMVGCMTVCVCVSFGDELEGG